MSISLKRAYEAPSRSDGCRILVERLWPRGLSKGDAKIGGWEILWKRGNEGSYRIHGSRILNPLQIWWKGARPQNICQGEPHRRPLAK